MEHRRRRFGDNGHDRDRVSGQAMFGLAHTKFDREMLHVGAALRLWQHDGCWREGDDCVEIGVGEPGIERIDAHDQFGRGGTTMGSEKSRGPLAPLLFGACGDGILQIEDQCVGAARQGSFELARTVGRDEEEGAHAQALGRFKMKACRLVSATSVPSCLNAWW